MTPETFVSAAVVRWLSLVSLAALIGGLCLEVLLVGEDDARTVDRGVQRWTALAASALLLATVAELLIRVHTLTGYGAAESLRAIPVVLDRTHFGRVWSGRLGALVLVGLILWFRKHRVGIPTHALVLGVAGTTVVTGHAGDWGDLSASALMDAGHLLASTTWVGGLFALALIVFPNRRRWREERLRIVLGRFSGLAGLCLAIVVITGGYNGWAQLRSWSALWSTRYGQVLLAKLCLAAGLVWLGAVNRYGVLPHRGRAPDHVVARVVRRLAFRSLATRPDGPEAAALLRRYVAREAILALLVFGCTAVLGELTPGRHMAHLRDVHEDHE